MNSGKQTESSTPYNIAPDGTKADDHTQNTTTNTAENPASLNEKLQTQHIDVLDEDKSFDAGYVRMVTRLVGRTFTPRQVLVVLKVLKAATITLLGLNLLANLMYIIFVQCLGKTTTTNNDGSVSVSFFVGTMRDLILRLYAIVLSLIALGIELNYRDIVKRYAGLQGFMSRSIFMLFITTITSSYPDRHREDYIVTVPSSAVGFQRVTSIALTLCAFGYFATGAMCFDRFTAKAFLSTQDPRITTAIAPPPESNSPTLV